MYLYDCNNWTSNSWLSRWFTLIAFYEIHTLNKAFCVTLMTFLKSWSFIKSYILYFHGMSWSKLHNNLYLIKKNFVITFSLYWFLFYKFCCTHLNYANIKYFPTYFWFHNKCITIYIYITIKISRLHILVIHKIEKCAIILIS